MKADFIAYAIRHYQAASAEFRIDLKLFGYLKKVLKKSDSRLAVKNYVRTIINLFGAEGGTCLILRYCQPCYHALLCELALECESSASRGIAVYSAEVFKQSSESQDTVAVCKVQRH